MILAAYAAGSIAVYKALNLADAKLLLEDLPTGDYLVDLGGRAIPGHSGEFSYTAYEPRWPGTHEASPEDAAVWKARTKAQQSEHYGRPSAQGKLPP